MNDFEVMKHMADNGMDIRVAPLASNLKRYQTGKDGYGEVTIAVDNVTIQLLNDYIGGLYLMSRAEFMQFKGEK